MKEYPFCFYQTREEILPCIRELFERYPNLNISDEKGNSPLMIASKRVNPQVVEFFLSNGANPRHTNNEGQTALHSLYWGTAESAANIVQQLVDHGADINATDHVGNTPLHSIMKETYAHAPTEPGMMALQLGADPNAINDEGKLPLHILAQHIWSLLDPELFLVLIPISDLNLQDNAGNTPFHYLLGSAKNNWTLQSHGEMIKSIIPEMLRAGARTDIANNEGETVDDLLAKYFSSSSSMSSSSSSFGKKRSKKSKKSKKSMKKSRKKLGMKKRG